MLGGHNVKDSGTILMKKSHLYAYEKTQNYTAINLWRLLKEQGTEVMPDY